MKKNLLITIVFVLLALSSFAQMSVDPSHDIYTDIRVWESQGLVQNLPLLRPYPFQVLVPILKEVMQKGSPNQVRTATSYYEELTGTVIQFESELEGSVKHNTSESSTDASVLGQLGITGDVSFLNLASIGYDIKLAGYKTHPYLPLFEGSPYDISDDPAKIGPIEAFLNMNSQATVGTENLYLQGGITRSSFGSFYENNAVIGNDAFHTGNFIGMLRNNNWSYTQSLHVLGATNNNGNVITPNKFMSFHAISFKPIPKVKFTYYENIIYGDRFDPAYLLPVVPYMVTQSLGAYSDNLQMGIAIDATIVENISWNNNLLVDDISVNDIVQFDFDTKLRIVAQTGIVWSPNDSLAKLLTIDYTLISPFTYTHHHKFQNQETGESFFGGPLSTNYQNYTTNGTSIGTSIPPNSDRLSLSITLTPTERFDVKLLVNMTRSANISESLSNESAMQYLALPANKSFNTDGSIFNHFTAPDGTPLTESKEFGFLTQDTKMYVWQTGIEASYSLPEYNWGRLTFNFGYTFEYIKNYGVHENIFNGIGADTNYDPETGTITDNEKESGGSISEADVQAALDAWKDNLRDLVHHYISFSVRYNY